MKKIFVYLLLLMAGREVYAYSTSADTATPDTVYVSHKATTYLLFPQEVDMLDISLQDEYYAKIEGKNVFIRAKNDNAPQTNFLIKYGDSYLIGILSYANSPRQYLYDLRKEKSGAEQITTHTLSTDTADIGAIKQRLQQLQDLKSNSLLQSSTKDKIRFSLSGVYIDKQATYLKLTLHNQSSMDYTIDYIGFELIEKKGRRFSSNNRNIQPRAPLAALAAQKLPANQKTTLVYALQSYAMRSKSKLLITLRETAGARVLRLSIPARLIAKARRLK